MKIDVKTIKPYLTTENKKVIDPPRFPKVIVPYENEMKRNFADVSNSLISQLTQTMVGFLNNRK